MRGVLFTNIYFSIFFLDSASAFASSPSLINTCHNHKAVFNRVQSHRARSANWIVVVTSSRHDLEQVGDEIVDDTKVEAPATNSFRRVRRIQRFARLPVWPVWNGLFIWIVQKFFGHEVAAKLEDSITGRVCPNFFDYSETSPFIMLVHHCHSFSNLDPLRFIQRTFFPEGFPAHPHRGFTTVTYFLHGGFIHRDSLGVRQRYGNFDQQKARQRGISSGSKHTQWLNTGRGLLHEEMFDNSNTSILQPTRQELYQLWLNLPAREKLTEPTTILLGEPDETPLVTKDQSQTLVLAGSWNGHRAAAPIVSDITMLHVQIEAGGTWIYPHIPKSFKTILLYVRKGVGLQCREGPSDETVDIPVHHTAYFDNDGSQLVLQNSNSNDKVDFLLLAGEPLGDPFFASGPMVMSTPEEIDQAFADYQKGMFGIPWDHKLSDEEWMNHVSKANEFRGRN